MAISPFSDEVRKIVLVHIQDQQLIDVDLLATQLAMHPSQVYRKLKAELGINPSKFIRTLRLEVAEEYLLKTDISVKAIAFRVGFSSSSYFVQCFKAHFGYTPKAYRQMHDN